MGDLLESFVENGRLKT